MSERPSSVAAARQRARDRRKSPGQSLEADTRMQRVRLEQRARRGDTDARQALEAHQAAHPDQDQ